LVELVDEIAERIGAVDPQNPSVHDVVEDVGCAEGIDKQQHRRRRQRSAQHDRPGRASLCVLRRAPAEPIQRSQDQIAGNQALARQGIGRRQPVQIQQRLASPGQQAEGPHKEDGIADNAQAAGERKHRQRGSGGHAFGSTQRHPRTSAGLGSLS
jgi:hypothetical protein